MRNGAIFRLAVVSMGVCAIFLAPPAEGRTMGSELLGLITPESDLRPRKVTIEGPSMALAFGDAVLKCTWPLQPSGGAITFGSEERRIGEEVNRVVWWRDGDMVFSWASGVDPPEETDDFDGAGTGKGDAEMGKDEKRAYDGSIDEEQSGKDTLYLKSVGEDASGNYVCDVFFGAVRERSEVHKMEVRDVQISKPLLHVFRPNASVVEGECKISYPTFGLKQILTSFDWLIDDKPVPKGWRSSKTRNENELTETIIGTVTPDLVQPGRSMFKLTCLVMVEPFENSLSVSSEVDYEAEEGLARIAKPKGRTAKTTVAPFSEVEVAPTSKSVRKPKVEVTEAEGTTEGILKAVLLEMSKQTKVMEGRLEVDRKTFELKKQEMEFLKGLKRSPVKT